MTTLIAKSGAVIAAALIAMSATAQTEGNVEDQPTGVTGGPGADDVPLETAPAYDRVVERLRTGETFGADLSGYRATTDVLIVPVRELAGFDGVDLLDDWLSVSEELRAAIDMRRDELVKMRTRIEAHPALKTALEEKEYTPEDVVAVEPRGEGSIVLFVYPER